ncbi:hypothetical protein MKEN_00989300 [Mycena kentingensis (nom. inval.)]|nr:hypothetical protein MKEN_00989300 [Mycena kentingensis (nom. inval.)]
MSQTANASSPLPLPAPGAGDKLHCGLEWNGVSLNHVGPYTFPHLRDALVDPSESLHDKLLKSSNASRASSYANADDDTQYCVLRLFCTYYIPFKGVDVVVPFRVECEDLSFKDYQRPAELQVVTLRCHFSGIAIMPRPATPPSRTRRPCKDPVMPCPVDDCAEEKVRQSKIAKHLLTEHSPPLRFKLPEGVDVSEAGYIEELYFCRGCEETFLALYEYEEHFADCFGLAGEDEDEEEEEEDEWEEEEQEEETEDVPQENAAPRLGRRKRVDEESDEESAREEDAEVTAPVAKKARITMAPLNI